MISLIGWEGCFHSGLENDSMEWPNTNEAITALILSSVETNFNRIIQMAPLIELKSFQTISSGLHNRFVNHFNCNNALRD